MNELMRALDISDELVRTGYSVDDAAWWAVYLTGPDQPAASVTPDAVLRVAHNDN